MENIKQGVKHDTLSALRNCPLNGYALFPDVVTWKAEDEITQFEASKCTSHPGPGHGGFAGGITRSNSKTSSNPTLLVEDNLKTPPVHLGTLVRICPLGNPLEGGAEEANPDGAPDPLKRPHSINDNYCIMSPVPMARSVSYV